MESLRKVQSLNYDTLYLPHSLSMNEEDIRVSAKSKIRDYIEYREEK
jgi:hypothetical protein